MKLQRYDGNPILSPNPANAWESMVTTNPGAWYDEHTGEVNLLYRAAGTDPEHRIHRGLAVNTDGYHFERTSDQSVFSPSANGFDAGTAKSLLRRSTTGRGRLAATPHPSRPSTAG